MLISIAVIGALLVLSAYFSGSETALTASSRPLMHQLEQQGNPRASVVNRLLASRERLIGAILLGNNLVNILASALATSVLIGLFGDTGVAYATGIMTLLILIFSEILPKTYAIRNANRMALAVGPSLRLLVVLLAPVVQCVHWLVFLVLRLFGAQPAADQGHALAELRGVIDLHAARSGKREHLMLRSILDLDDVEVSEVMTHRRNLVAINIDQKPDTILEQVLQSPFTRLPLWKDEPDNIVGVVHAKALLREVHRLGGDTDALDVLSVAAPPWFIPDSTSLLDQLQAFRERREHFALVVDEYGTLMGVVTLEDILEDIVGDIADEHDLVGRHVRREADGSYVVNGSVTIRDINRELGWRLPDEDAVTVAGLVLHESRTIPQVGQVFRFHGFRFEVLRRYRNQITALRITPVGEARDESGAAAPAP